LAYLDQDQPGPEILAVIGGLPRRWGRMDRLSRLAVVEVGRALRSAGFSRDGRAGIDGDLVGGLIGASPHGSLATDLAYARTLAGGIDLASPTLFSYTLPNIALAEAASHFQLTGPVYALFAREEAAAEIEARRWLAEKPGPDFMVAGMIDIRPAAADCPGQADRDPGGRRGEVIVVNFKIVR